jgi:hypothetical protein
MGFTHVVGFLLQGNSAKDMPAYPLRDKRKNGRSNIRYRPLPFAEVRIHEAEVFIAAIF